MSFKSTARDMDTAGKINMKKNLNVLGNIIQNIGLFPNIRVGALQTMSNLTEL